MRLYIKPFAPNALRVQIVMLEKGISAEIIDVSEWSADDYHRLSPLGQVPALELDDGQVLTESLTICQYLDAVSPPPSLFGDTLEQRTRVAMWERRAEMGLFIPSIEYGHHTHPMFVGRLQQHPDWARTLVPKAERVVELFADQLDQSPFVSGDALSIADFTGVLGYFGLIAYGALQPSAREGIGKWSQMMLGRPSMAPLRQAAEFLQGAAPAQGVQA